MIYPCFLPENDTIHRLKATIPASAAAIPMTFKTVNFSLKKITENSVETTSTPPSSTGYNTARSISGSR